jgi:hypothetical protein
MDGHVVHECREQGRHFGSCFLQVIAELLRFLKRSYWPFAWDSSSAGGSSTGGHK